MISTKRNLNLLLSEKGGTFCDCESAEAYAFVLSAGSWESVGVDFAFFCLWGVLLVSLCD